MIKGMDSAFWFFLVLTIVSGVGWLGTFGYFATRWVRRGLGYSMSGDLGFKAQDGWRAAQAGLIGMGVTAAFGGVTLLISIASSVMGAL